MSVWKLFHASLFSKSAHRNSLISWSGQWVRLISWTKALLC